MAILTNIEVDGKNRNLIKKLYINQKAFVMVGETLLEACSIGRGLRKGCSLSPLLFIINDEAMVTEVCHKCVIGIRVGGKDSQHDKICRQLGSSCKLTERTKRVDKYAKYCCEGIWYKNQCEGNKGHVSITRVTVKVSISTDQQVQQVSHFKYLGSWISDDGYAIKGIRARTAMGKTRKIVGGEN